MKNPLDKPSSTGRRVRLLQALAAAGTLAIGGVAMHVANASTTDDGSTPGMFHHHVVCTPEQLRAHLDKVLDEAGAGAEQKQQIETAITSAMTAEHADMQQYHSNLQQLKALLTTDPIDDAAVAALRVDQDRLAVALSDRALDTAATVAKSLTPDQRAKVGAQIDQMMSAHGVSVHVM